MPYFLTPSSFFVGPLDTVSLDTVSLAIVSLLTPSPLDMPFRNSMSCAMGSPAKAADAPARPNERTAAEIPRTMRVLMVMDGSSLLSPKRRDDPGTAVVTREIEKTCRAQIGSPGTAPMLLLRRGTRARLRRMGAGRTA
jgi:hypothetical protein